MNLTLGDVLQSLSSLGATGILGVFVLWFVPRIFDKAAKVRKEELATYKQSLDDLTEAYKEDMRYEREMCGKQFTELMGGINRGHEMMSVAFRGLGDQINAHDAFAKQLAARMGKD